MRHKYKAVTQDCGCDNTPSLKSKIATTDITTMGMVKPKPDCSAVEAERDEALAAKTDAETKLAESEQAKEQALADKAMAEQERDDAKAKLAECEEKPTCEAVPVYSIGGALVFNGYSCGDSTVTSLGGDNVAGVDAPPSFLKFQDTKTSLREPRTSPPETNKPKMIVALID